MNASCKLVLGLRTQRPHACNLKNGNPSPQGVDVGKKSWNRKYKELLKFKEVNGHCLVHWQHPVLGTWVVWQRRKYKTGQMSPAEYEHLSKIGFAFNGKHARSAVFVEMILRFHAEYGHCTVSAYNYDLEATYPGLAGWVRRIRRKRRLGFVAQDTIDTLDSINFDWDPRSSKFERRFEELKAFKAQYGHCNVPVTYHENPNLGTWLQNLRRYRRQDKGKKESLSISTEQQNRLEELGVTLGKGDDSWDFYYKLLRKVYKERGTSNGPYRFGSKYFGLKDWVQHQRELAQEGRLANDRIQLLNELEFAWDTERMAFDNNVSELSSLCSELGFQTVFLALDLLQDDLDGALSLKRSHPSNRKPKVQQNNREHKAMNGLQNLREWYLNAKRAAGQGDLDKEWIATVHQLGFWLDVDADVDVDNP